MRRTTLAQILTIVVIATVAAACGGGSSSPGTDGPSSGSTTSSRSSGGSKPAVDLVFTGSVDVTAHGSAGVCQVGVDSSGAPAAFGFNATEADYPGLGQNLNFSEDVGSHKLSVKWLIAQGNPNVWFGYMDPLATVSKDHHSLTLDADLPKNPGHPEHVSGTIICP